MSDFGGQVIGSTGQSGQVIGLGSRTYLSDDENTTIERKLEEQIDKPLAELDEEEQNETDKLFETSAIGTKDIGDIPELVNMFPNKKKGGNNVNRKLKKNRRTSKNNKKISPHNKNNTELLRIRHIKNKGTKLKSKNNMKQTKKLKHVKKKNRSMKKTKY